MTPPGLTAAASEYLAGRSVVLRVSPRNGCCGGRAEVPVAEPGPPRDTSRYQTVEAEGVRWYLDRALPEEAAAWSVDVAGFGRWRRLLIEGATSLDPERDGGRAVR